MVLCRGSQLISFAQRQCVRAVKEMDPKSIGLCPQGFESSRCRQVRAATTRVALPGPEINGLQESMLGCGTAKHHSSRVPAVRNPSFLCAPGSQVFDWWATHACMATPVGYGYWHPTDFSVSTTVCPSGQGDGPEIHWALPAGVQIPSLSHKAQLRRHD